jgi:RNA polymerase sigma factor (sigma-70 family)
MEIRQVAIIIYASQAYQEQRLSSMNDVNDISELIPKLHLQAKRVLPRRLHGRVRPSDLAQSTAQILLKAKISDISCIASWTMGVFRNLIAKTLAREATVRNLHERIHALRMNGRQGVPDTAISATIPLSVGDSFSDILSAAKLDNTEKTILNLYFVEGETMRSIATATGMPLSTLHNRFQQALSQVRVACDASPRPA